MKKMKSFRLFLFLGIFMALSLFAGCDSDYTEEEIYSGNLIVYNYINPGCANKILSANIENESQNHEVETIMLKAIDNGTRLEIKHNNARHYRTGEIIIEASIHETNIFIKEKGANISSDEICNYSLTYEIPLTAYGQYTIKINDGKSYKFDYSLNTEVTINVGTDV